MRNVRYNKFRYNKEAFDTVHSAILEVIRTRERIERVEPGSGSGRALFRHTSDQPLFFLLQQIIDSPHQLQQSLRILFFSGLIAELLPFFQNFTLHALSEYLLVYSI